MVTISPSMAIRWAESNEASYNSNMPMYHRK